jgi:hypothetical protein
MLAMRGIGEKLHPLGIGSFGGGLILMSFTLPAVSSWRMTSRAVSRIAFKGRF